MSAISPRFLAIARPYVRRTLAHELDGVEVSGLDAFARLSAERPLICAANHVAMWDPLVLVALEARLPGVGHALMDAANLARLPFFAHVGAVPLDRSDHNYAVADLDRAAALAREPGERLWIFPQGEQRPAHLRPLQLRPGVLRLHVTSGAAVVPVAISYAFREAPRPVCLVSFGSAIEDVMRLDTIERGIERELSRIDVHLAGGCAGFETLVESRVMAPGESVWTKWLGRLMGSAG